MKHFPLIFLSLLLSACSSAQFTPVPRGQSQAVQASPAAQGTRTAQDALIQASPTMRPEYTATVDDVGTQNAAQALHDAAQATHDEKVLEGIQVNSTASAESAQATGTAFVINTTSDASDRESNAASQSVQLTKQANDLVALGLHMTQTAAAPTISEAATRATFTGQDATAHLVEQWGVGIGLPLLGLALVIAVWRILPQREQDQQQAASQVPAIAPTFHPAAPAKASNNLRRRTIPAGVPEAVLLTFAQHVALSDWPGGDPFTRAEWVDSGKMTRPQWNALLFFMTKENNYARPINPSVANSSLTFTPDGEEYLRRFRDEQGTSPLVAAIYPN